MVYVTQCAGAVTGGGVYIQMANLLIDSCWLFIFAIEDITQDVTEFNVITKTKSMRNRTRLIKHFYHMVQIYLDAKQYVLEFHQLLYAI